MSRFYGFLLVLLFAGLWSMPVSAQWSSNPDNSLQISGADAGQAQPKVVASPDGSFYISWFGGPGYNVYLQRVDAHGVAQWAEGGIQIADRSFSSTQDYGLAVSPDGHALLSYRLESGGVHAVAQRVAPDGSLLWGEDGVIVSGSPGASSPRITSGPDGGAFVAWSSDEGAIVVQRVSSDGSVVWADGGVTLSTPTGFFFIADIHGNPDGSVIVSGNAQLTTFDRRLWAQKLDSDGASMWGADPVEVFDGTGGALQFGYFPEFVLDGQGGAVFAWYLVGAPGEGLLRVQHIESDGTLAFQQNGVTPASEPANWQRTAPVADYDPATGDIYVVWRHELTQGGATNFGASAQRINPEGDLLWGNGGVELVPMNPLQTANPQVAALPGGGIIAAGSLGSAPQPMTIIAGRLTSSGEASWDEPAIDIKSPASGSQVSRVQNARSQTHEQVVYVWQDASGGNPDGAIMAQNVSFNGVLGEVVESEDSPPQVGISTESLEITVHPDDVATATVTLSNLAPEGADALTFTASVPVADSVLVDFEDGQNPYGFTFGFTPGDGIVTTGGNPGHWFENNGLETFTPILYIPSATGGPFLGDYVAGKVSEITVDAQTLSASLGIPDRDFTLILTNFDGGGPDGFEQHKYVYFVYYADAPQPGDGWKSFTFDIPYDFDGVLPDGWEAGYYGDPESLPEGWTFQDVISNVDEVNLMWGHPAWFYLLQGFHLGVDNVAIARTGESTILTVDPTEGSIPAQSEIDLTLTADATDLEEGDYPFSLVIHTNDPESPEVVVEVNVRVRMLSNDDDPTNLTFELAAAYPNPSAGMSTIDFSIPHHEQVLIEAFDVLGRRVAVLLDQDLPAGLHSVAWDTSGLASGTYLYRMTAGDFSSTQGAVVIR